MTKKRSKIENVEKVDGLGPFELRRIRSALRKVWVFSYARKLVVQRCTDAQGFPKCEKCRQRCPKIEVDHVQPCGVVDGGFIARLFVPSSRMRGLCHECHLIVTSLGSKTKSRKKKLFME